MGTSALPAVPERLRLRVPQGRLSCGGAPRPQLRDQLPWGLGHSTAQGGPARGPAQSQGPPRPQEAEAPGGVRAEPPAGPTVNSQGLVLGWPGLLREPGTGAGTAAAELRGAADERASEREPAWPGSGQEVAAQHWFAPRASVAGGALCTETTVRAREMHLQTASRGRWRLASGLEACGGQGGRGTALPHGLGAPRGLPGGPRRRAAGDSPSRGQGAFLKLTRALFPVHCVISLSPTQRGKGAG